MRHATLCFPIEIDEGKITNLWLGMKRVGFGAGKWNGFGGKVEEGETVMQATVRELKEESGFETEVDYLIPAATLKFTFPHKPSWNQIVHVFLTETYRGNPKETEEMSPALWGADDIPYDKMWPDDAFWLPIVLRRGGDLHGEFTFDETGERIKEMVLTYSTGEDEEER